MTERDSRTSARLLIIGIYPVESVNDCFLVECSVVGATERPNFGAITQTSSRERSDWQVAYDEKLLDEAGSRVVADLLQHSDVLWPQLARVTFFFHHLDVDRPLVTPFGTVALPSPSRRPLRLDAVSYDPP